MRASCGRSVVFAALTAGAVGGAAGCRQAVPPVERGRVLVATAGCAGCHTATMAGHREGVTIAAPFTPAPGSPWTIATTNDFTAFSGPWGVSFAANLTPDALTGLRSGVWTEDVFIKALRTGKHMGTARDILPPMPWKDFAQLSDDDLRAIWAYLGTMPAITNHVPEPIPPVNAPGQASRPRVGKDADGRP